MSQKIALLRAVNVGGRKLPMSDLRALCEVLGWADVQTYIQSGNVVFTSDLPLDRLESDLEKLILARTKLDVPVIVRTAESWSGYAAQMPFPAVEQAPNRHMLILSKRPPAPNSDQLIAARAQVGEQVVLIGDALWIHFADGVGRSKLTPALIDRAMGSPATARNWRTVLKLQEMLNS